MSAVCISKTGDLPLINLLRFKGKPIFDQLILEEKLLRRSSDNWCIVNDGTDRPTIVSGLSGKLSQLIEVEKVMNEGIPVIRRFSGGGTVIVDNGTIFVTFICNKGAIDQLQPFPQPIMSWTGQFYSQVLGGAHKFNLRENDYCFGDHKFGGNAQSITKSRWVHHTSFLWDFDTHNMSYLTYPLKTPKYRLVWLPHGRSFYLVYKHFTLDLALGLQYVPAYTAVRTWFLYYSDMMGADVQHDNLSETHPMW